MPCRVCKYESGHAQRCPAYSGEPIKIRFTPVERGEMRAQYLGTHFEEDLFGSVNIRDQKYLAELERLGATWDEKRQTWHLPFGKALELVKGVQPFADPENPDNDFLRELLFEVQDLLAEHKRLTEIKAYTAVKTPFDVYHGGDAIITANFGGREILVKLDASLNPEKLAQAQMNGGFTEKDAVAIGEITTVEENPDEYSKQIAAIASLVQQQFREEMKKISPGDESQKKAA
jgi:hypothetical protein